MTFLPIVQRELRVAARRKGTFVIRAAVAFLGIVMGGCLLAACEFGGLPAQRAGAEIFGTLSWYTWMLSLLAGVFLASDCLSEERREGTLGLLFLTDLKGYDVVLGKVAGVAINAFYGLLAVLPVLSLCMLTGGVSWAEFWRTCLALVNTLFFAVAGAIWMSANCRSGYRAVTGSIALLVAFLALTSIAAALATVASRFGTALFYAGATSPMEAFRVAAAADYAHQVAAYWISLGMSHLAGWVFLGLASWRLKHFAESAQSSGVWQRALTRNILTGGAKRRTELLDINPVLWLLDDFRRLRWVVWALALAGAGALIFISVKWPTEAVVSRVFMAWPFYFLLKLFFGVQACRFFSEARRTGALELLCCTPLTIQAMIRGQWQALRRIFLWPVVVLVAVQFVCMLPTVFPDASARISLVGRGRVWSFNFLDSIQMFDAIVDFFALGWFGMWSALSFKKPGTATGLTLLWVLILPAILYCIPSLVTNTVLIIVGYSKLQQYTRRGRPDWKGASFPA
jgi:ABC-type transport system involved in cytochrome c biogenesis permease component